MITPMLPTTNLVDASLALIRDGQAPSGAFPARPSFEHYRHAWFRELSDPVLVRGDTRPEASV
jgi:hypothetical protein